MINIYSSVPQRTRDVEIIDGIPMERREDHIGEILRFDFESHGSLESRQVIGHSCWHWRWRPMISSADGCCCCPISWAQRSLAFDATHATCGEGNRIQPIYCSSWPLSRESVSKKPSRNQRNSWLGFHCDDFISDTSTTQLGLYSSMYMYSFISR